MKFPTIADGCLEGSLVSPLARTGNKSLGVVTHLSEIGCVVDTFIKTRVLLQIFSADYAHNLYLLMLY